MISPIEFSKVESNAVLGGQPKTNNTEEPSPIADLIRTRPEAFDFGDCPDVEPLSSAYAAHMDAKRLAWIRDLLTPDEPAA